MWTMSTGSIIILLIASSMRNFLTSPRNRWLLGIGVVAFAVGGIAKNVISYPAECIPSTPVELSQLIRI